MKYKILVMSYIIIFFAFNSCSNKQEEQEALTYLSRVRQHYYANEFSEAHLLLDSLSEKYPTAIKTKQMGRNLRDSILRTESGYKIDFIYDEMNERKIKITNIRKANRGIEQISDLEKQIDSLHQLITPHKDIINAITTKELQLAARTQCVTCIQQTRTQ